MVQRSACWTELVLHLHGMKADYLFTENKIAKYVSTNKQERNNTTLLQSFIFAHKYRVRRNNKIIKYFPLVSLIIFFPFPVSGLLSLYCCYFLLPVVCISHNNTFSFTLDQHLNYEIFSRRPASLIRV